MSSLANLLRSLDCIIQNWYHTCKPSFRQGVAVGDVNSGQRVTRGEATVSDFAGGWWKSIKTRNSRSILTDNPFGITRSRGLVVVLSPGDRGPCLTGQLKRSVLPVKEVWRILRGGLKSSYPRFACVSFRVTCPPRNRSWLCLHRGKRLSRYTRGHDWGTHMLVFKTKQFIPRWNLPKGGFGRWPPGGYAVMRILVRPDHTVKLRMAH